MKSTRRLDSAVSPVIGILLMIVVTVIIAAVVSGFAGNLVQSQQKVPQAQLSGSFSVHDGFTIRHNGGDSIPTKDMMVTIRNSRLFGPDVEQRSIQVVNGTIITDSSDTKPWLFSNGTIGITSFNAGETALVNSTNCFCDKLQPIITPSDFAASISADGLTYSGTKTVFWGLCFKNPANVGKSFIMDVSDKATGKIISTANVPITT
ncbi:MAG: type IV pilin N-terminal domain-containing protein [Methanospirillum sp.]|nr:type IV pilin N-terminal domain-containing protein [Methanospirillum sp.]MDD1729796.1 type IV pilin N-terminal domain-containing protein [Methanospirillum sp.]